MRKGVQTPLYGGTVQGLSHVNVDSSTGFVFVSGQVDSKASNEVTQKAIGEQTVNAMKNLKHVLEQVGSSMSKTLQIRIYIRGELFDYLDHVVPIINDRIENSNPALTGIGVVSLMDPNALIEIEAIAKQ